VVLLPYHRPIVLAKRLATIDVLPKGRMSLFTIGVGTLPGEAVAAGVDFTTRGRRTDEAIDVPRLLWSGAAGGVTDRGEFHTLDQACSFPKPYQHTTLPIQSADRGWPQPGEPDVAATGTSPSVGCPATSEPSSSP